MWWAERAGRSLSFAFDDASAVLLLKGISQIAEQADLTLSLLPFPPPTPDEDVAARHERDAQVVRGSLVDRFLGSTVQSGVQEKVLATKVYRTTVAMDASGSVPFSLVGEDLTYTMPSGTTSENFIFYIGFDPQALTPEPKPARKKK